MKLRTRLLWAALALISGAISIYSCSKATEGLLDDQGGYLLDEKGGKLTFRKS